MTMAAIAHSATAQPIPAASVNACTQRVAEEMVVATRDIELTSGGPVDALKGTQTLFLRNRTTGQTAECRVNTIDAYVLSVTVSPQVRPPQPVPPIAPISEASNRACLQRTAEEMVVATRDLDVTGVGSVNAANGVGTVFLRNRVTGQTAECRVNTITNTVLSVTITSPRPPQPQPVPPTGSRPVPPNDPTARRCENVVSNKICGSFGGVQTISFQPNSRRYFVANGVDSIRGGGQFSRRIRWRIVLTTIAMLIIETDRSQARPTLSFAKSQNCRMQSALI